MPPSDVTLQNISLQAEAPEKPATGEPCNGCGVCCAAEPCSLAGYLLRQYEGRCRALVWSGQERRYRCGMVIAPQQYRRWLLPASGRLFRRWIAAGRGCDSDAEVVEADGRRV